MDCGKREAFVAAVWQHYAYLFDNYGFRLEHCEQGRQGEYCLVGLESTQARVKFAIEQGMPVTYLGTLESPMRWGDEVDGVTIWYVANALLNFVEQKGGAPVAPKSGLYRNTGDQLSARGPGCARTWTIFGPPSRPIGPKRGGRRSTPISQSG
jgi:hypothetical protein